MKIKIGILLVVSQMLLAQTQKRLKGTVLFNNLPIANVDVVNDASQISTKTDENGIYFIPVNVGDSLVFISKEFELKRIKITEKDFVQDHFSTILNRKPEELKEVIVMKMPSFKLDFGSKYENQKLNEIEMDKSQAEIKNPFVYNGKTSGIDFVKFGKLVNKLLGSSSKTKEKMSDKTSFGVLVNQKFETDYLLKTLHLEKEKLSDFLKFCEKDSHSKSVNEKSNPLAVLDFLLKKKEEFQKLP